MAGALFACALVASACDGVKPVARGFGSKQVVATRDSSITFAGVNPAGAVIYGTGGPTLNQPWNYWTLDLSTGTVQDDGASVPQPPPSSVSPPPSPYVCLGTVASNGLATLQIFDSSSGAETDLTNVVSFAQCPGADGLLTLFAADASGDMVLETGPFSDLQPVPLALQVKGVGGWSVDGTTNAPSSVLVQAASPSAPDEMGVYTIDLVSNAIVDDVPAIPASVAWAVGATPVGSLQSTSVSPGGFSSLLSIDDHYVYTRRMDDGGSTVFAGPFPDGAASELALFQVPPGSDRPAPEEIVTYPLGAGSSPHLVGWTLGAAADTNSARVIWDDATRQVIACPSSPNAVVIGKRSSDGSKVLFVTQQSCCNYQGSGPLTLVTLAGSAGGIGSCALLVASNVVTAAFSPDGSAMFWLVQPPAGEAQLWAAASDGSGAHLLGSGTMQNIHFVASGGAKLELILDGDLVWLDLHASSVQLHYVAEHLFYEIYDFGNGPWLLTGYGYSPQDQTGTLGLVNRDTGEKRAISPAVTQFFVVSASIDADGGLLSADSSDAGVGRAFSVLYQVRGRNPSSQDGLWVATITPADLQ